MNLPWNTGIPFLISTPIENIDLKTLILGDGEIKICALIALNILYNYGIMLYFINKLTTTEDTIQLLLHCVWL